MWSAAILTFGGSAGSSSVPVGLFVSVWICYLKHFLAKKTVFRFLGVLKEAVVLDAGDEVLKNGLLAVVDLVDFVCA